MTEAMATANSSASKISTSRLARLANIDSRLLFERLLARQWIVREQQDGKNSYRLTAKGEFEGGEYQTSDKFGTYIVWPPELLQHRLFTGLEEKRLTATALGKASGVPGRLINLLLQQLGWLRSVATGWQVTERGQRRGGETRETKDGASYVSWPGALQEDQYWQQALAQLDQQVGLPRALDGRLVDDCGERLISNWLYLQRVHFAQQWPLSEGLVDFYLPDIELVILYWGNRQQDKTATALQHKLTRAEALCRAGYVVLELTPMALEELDKRLTRELQKAGLRLSGLPG